MADTANQDRAIGESVAKVRAANDRAAKRPKPVAHRTVITYHQVLSKPDEPLIVELDRTHRVQIISAGEYGPDILYKYVVVSDA